MRAVAILAGGSVGAALGRQRAVGAFVILVDLSFVADRTIDLRRHGIAGPFVRRRAAGMALHASDGRSAAAGRVMVDGGVHLGFVDEQRDGFPTARHLEVGIAVATLAVLIGHALGIEDLADFVRLMAIHTGGNHVFLFP